MPLTYKLLASLEVGDSLASQLEVSSIPNGFDYLVVSGLVRIASGSSNLTLKFNNSDSVYSERLVSGTTTTTSTTNKNIQIAGTSSSEFYAFNLNIFNYSTSFNKSVICTWSGPTTSGTSSGQWQNSAQVSSLQFDVQSTTFASGTRINIYGVAGNTSGNSVGPGASWKRFVIQSETLTTSGTWTLVPGVSSVDVIAVGGGGNGGPGGTRPKFTTQPQPGGGGGSAGTVTTSTVNVSAPVSYTIGAAGGTTTFNSPVAVNAPGASSALAPGGGGGGGGAPPGVPGGPGTAGGTANFASIGVGGVSFVVGGGGGGGGGGAMFTSGGGGGVGGTNAGPGGGGGTPSPSWGNPYAGGPGGSANSFGSGGGGGGGPGQSDTGNAVAGGSGGAGQPGRIFVSYKKEIT